MAEQKGNFDKEHFVSKVVPDPKNPPKTLLLTGYLGPSSEEGYTRLYFDPQLSRYVEIPDAAILNSQVVPAEKSTLGLGESYVWINPDAELIHGPVGAGRKKAKFLEGPIVQEFMAGAQFGGAVPQFGGGQQLTPAQSLPFCAVPTPSAVFHCPTQQPPCGFPTLPFCPTETIPPTRIPPCNFPSLPFCPTETCPPSRFFACPSAFQFCPPFTVPVCPTEACPPSQLLACEFGGFAQQQGAAAGQAQGQRQAPVPGQGAQFGGAPMAPQAQQFGAGQFMTPPFTVFCPPRPSLVFNNCPSVFEVACTIRPSIVDICPTHVPSVVMVCPSRFEVACTIHPSIPVLCTTACPIPVTWPITLPPTTTPQFGQFGQTGQFGPFGQGGGFFVPGQGGGAG